MIFQGHTSIKVLNSKEKGINGGSHLEFEVAYVLDVCFGVKFIAWPCCPFLLYSRHTVASDIQVLVV